MNDHAYSHIRGSRHTPANLLKAQGMRSTYLHAVSLEKASIRTLYPRSHTQRCFGQMYTLSLTRKHVHNLWRTVMQYCESLDTSIDQGNDCTMIYMIATHFAVARTVRQGAQTNDTRYRRSCWSGGKSSLVEDVAQQMRLRDIQHERNRISRFPSWRPHSDAQIFLAQARDEFFVQHNRDVVIKILSFVDTWW